LAAAERASAIQIVKLHGAWTGPWGVETASHSGVDVTPDWQLELSSPRSKKAGPKLAPWSVLQAMALQGGCGSVAERLLRSTASTW